MARMAANRAAMIMGDERVIMFSLGRPIVRLQIVDERLRNGHSGMEKAGRGAGLCVVRLEGHAHIVFRQKKSAGPPLGFGTCWTMAHWAKPLMRTIRGVERWLCLHFSASSSPRLPSQTGGAGRRTCKGGFRFGRLRSISKLGLSGNFEIVIGLPPAPPPPAPPAGPPPPLPPLPPLPADWACAGPDVRAAMLSMPATVPAERERASASMLKRLALRDLVALVFERLVMMGLLGFEVGAPGAAPCPGPCRRPVPSAVRSRTRLSSAVNRGTSDGADLNFPVKGLAGQPRARLRDINAFCRDEPP